VFVIDVQRLLSQQAELRAIQHADVELDHVLRSPLAGRLRGRQIEALALAGDRGCTRTGAVSVAEGAQRGTEGGGRVNVGRQ